MSNGSSIDYDPQNEFEEKIEQRRPSGNTINAQKQRAALQFDLNGEPLPPAWRGLVHVSIYPQDPFVDEPVIRTMPASDMRAGLSNDRFRVRDSTHPLAQPTVRGDYVFSPKEPAFDQVNVLYYANLTLRMCEYYARRPLPWVFGAGPLILDPCAGTTHANAYYDEGQRMVAFFNSKSRGKEIRSAQSSDIVSHEVGHAILDGLRDLLNGSFSFGPEAFHEAFCDTMAILVALHDNGLIERLIQLTDGNLRVSSFLPHLAEQLAHSRWRKQRGPRSEPVFYLRSALNDFTAASFDDLPYLPKNLVTELGREAHSYSRVYTGALYDILVSIYESLKKQRWSPSVALGMARDIVGGLLIRSVELGPVGESSLEDFAWSMLAADRLFFNAAYGAIIQREMLKRKILTRRQLSGFTERASQTPPLVLPETVVDVESAQQFIHTHRGVLGLPSGVEFFAQAGYRDGQGNRFLTCFSPTPLKLGAQHGKYAGQTVQLFGGLSLMFGPDRCLRHMCFRPVTQEDFDQATAQIADMLDHRHLALGLSNRESGVLERMAILTVGSDGEPNRDVIRTISPAFVEPPPKGTQRALADLLPQVVRVSVQAINQPTLLEYAEQWLEAMGLKVKK